MKLPEIGAKVRLYPAPLAAHPDDDRKGVTLRRVQDGAGNFGHFLPSDGADRIFDYHWHDRLLAGDVCFTDPRTGGSRATYADNPRTTSIATPKSEG